MVRSWQCSPSRKSLLLSNTCSSGNSSHTHQTAHSSTSDASIRTNLSLLTLPSVPSLQKPTVALVNNAATPIFLTTIKPRDDRFAHVNFLAVHNNLLYSASGNEIYVYDIASRSLIDAFSSTKLSNGSAKSIVFLDKKVFTAHQDCKIRVWKMSPDGKRHNLVAILPTLEDRLRRFILPRKYVSVRRHKKKLLIEHYDAVSGLATTCPNENLTSVLSISWDRSIKFWDPQSFRCLQSIDKAHDDAINAVAVSKDGLIYTASADRRIKVWKREGEIYGEIATLEKHKSAVNALALSRDGSILFSGSCDRSILAWEREDSAHHMAVAGALRGHAKAILCLINVQDFLLSGSADRTVRIWQGGIEGRYCCLTVLDGHQTPVRSLAAKKGGGSGCMMVCSGGFDGEIKIWQVENIHR